MNSGKQAGPEGVWNSRPYLAGVVRAIAIGGPVLVATLLARGLLWALPTRHALGWDLFALVLALFTSLLLGRYAARLLPLAVLLKMTMIFPDQAPARIKVARRASSKAELARRLEHPDSDTRETATTLLALVTALGRHDRKTRGHSERVRLYCDLVGEQLGLSASERGRLRWVGLLHDIGKLDVAAEVLNKPGKLTDHEWDAVKAHPHSGARLAAPLADWLGPWFDGIEHHHERYDGTGYPHGLAAEEISQAGRTVSVVDAFETMTAARSYKSPMSTAAARAELARCAGTHFDPAVVRAFLAISLPRLLWTMGPLTFLINFPFLRWIPASSGRIADVAAAGTNGAVSAVGATAVTVAAVSSPVVAGAHQHPVAHVQLAAADQRAHSAGAAPIPGSGGPVGTVSAVPAASTAPALTASVPALPATGPASAPSPRATASPNVNAPSSSMPSEPAPSPGGPSSDATGATPSPSEGTPAPPTKTPPGKAKPPTKTPPKKAKPPKKTAPEKAKPPKKTAPEKAKPPKKTAPEKAKPPK